MTKFLVSTQIDEGSLVSRNYQREIENVLGLITLERVLGKSPQWEYETTAESGGYFQKIASLKYEHQDPQLVERLLTQVCDDLEDEGQYIWWKQI